jgi:hypothetical protein
VTAVQGPWPTSTRRAKPQKLRTWTADEVRALGVVTDLVTAANVLGIGRTRAYELARHGKFPIPVIPAGAKYVVPTKPLIDLLHIAEPGEPGTSPAA